jgi:hypothetical protein
LLRAVLRTATDKLQYEQIVPKSVVPHKRHSPPDLLDGPKILLVKSAAMQTSRTESQLVETPAIAPLGDAGQHRILQWSPVNDPGHPRGDVGRPVNLALGATRPARG